MIDVIAAKTGLQKTVTKRVVDEMLSTIVDVISAGDHVRLYGFGTFSTKQSSERVGRDMNLGMPVSIPSKTTPIFKAGRSMKDALL